MFQLFSKVTTTPVPGNGGIGAGYILAAICGAVPGVIAAIMALMRTRGEIRGQARKDAMDEWQKTVVDLRLQIGDMEKDMVEVKKSETACWDAHRSAERAAHTAEVKSTEQAGEIKLLRYQMQRMQIATGEQVPGTSFPVFLVTTQDGIINFASPQIAGLLHWLPDRSEHGIIGKSAEVLLVDSDVAEFRQRLKDLQAGNWTPDPGVARRKTLVGADGQAVECLVNSTAFKSPAGSWVITTEVRPAPTKADLKEVAEGRRDPGQVVNVS